MINYVFRFLFFFHEIHFLVHQYFLPSYFFTKFIFCSLTIFWLVIISHLLLVIIFCLLYQILSVNNNVSTKIFSVWFIILLMLHSIWQLNSIKIKTLFKYFNIFLKFSTKYQGKVLFTQFIYSATQLWKWQYHSWNVSTKYFCMQLVITRVMHRHKHCPSWKQIPVESYCYRRKSMLPQGNISIQLHPTLQLKRELVKEKFVTWIVKQNQGNISIQVQ